MLTCGSGWAIFGGIFDYDAKEARLTEVAGLLEAPDVWDDPRRAQDLGRERKSLEDVVSGVTSIDVGLRDASDLFEMAQAESDTETLVARLMGIDPVAMAKTKAANAAQMEVR